MCSVIHSPVPPETSQLVTVLAVPDTTPGVLSARTPRAPSAATQLKGIIDQPKPAGTRDGLLLVKWPPDTTGGKLM